MSEMGDSGGGETDTGEAASAAPDAAADAASVEPGEQGPGQSDRAESAAEISSGSSEAPAGEPGESGPAYARPGEGPADAAGQPEAGDVGSETGSDQAASAAPDAAADAASEELDEQGLGQSDGAESPAETSDGSRAEASGTEPGESGPPDTGGGENPGDTGQPRDSRTGSETDPGDDTDTDTGDTEQEGDTGGTEDGEGPYNGDRDTGTEDEFEAGVRTVDEAGTFPDQTSTDERDNVDVDPATTDLAGDAGNDSESEAGEREPADDTEPVDDAEAYQAEPGHDGSSETGQAIDAVPRELPATPGDVVQPHTPEQKPLLPYTRTDSGGLNFLSDTDRAGVNAGKNMGIPGSTDVVVHANQNGFGLSDGTRLSPSQMADAIHSAPDYPGGPVRLVACRAGALDDGAAQQVANSLNQPVIAATETVWPAPDGRLVVGPNPWTPSGQWRTFNPKVGQ
jgi:hypothetical protein